MIEKKLTAKQQKFAKAAASSKSATEAAIKAGYSKKTARSIASENLTKPNIRKAVEEEVDRAAKAAGVDTEYVYRKLKLVIETCSQLSNKEDADGGMVDATNANSALKTLGGFLKMGKDKDDGANEVLNALAETLRGRINAGKEG